MLFNSKIFDLLIKSNDELKRKIDISTKKYNEILQKIKEKENNQSEAKLSLQIKEMEKEISANNAETEHYKKLINQLKGKIEFKANLERASNLQGILKQETQKNKELRKQLSTIERVNGVQKQYIKNYDKENQISDKLDYLKNEVDQAKSSIKEYQNKSTKQDRFIRLVHEKILSLEIMIKKMKEPKIEKTKLFTKEELKKTLDDLNNLKKQITDNRNQLNLITKQSDNKIHELLKQNKEIEEDYKKKEKENKELIFKKNELKRTIKTMNTGNYRGGSKPKKAKNFSTAVAIKQERKESEPDVHEGKINHNEHIKIQKEVIDASPRQQTQPQEQNEEEQNEEGENEDQQNEDQEGAHDSGLDHQEGEEEEQEEPGLPHEEKVEVNPPQHKLFSKNPNKKNSSIVDQQLNEGEDSFEDEQHDLNDSNVP